MALRVVTAPASSPVTLDDAKSHLRVDFPDDDALITALISAATFYAESYTQRCFVTRTLEWIRNDWPDRLRFPLAPVQSVASLKYVDAQSVQQTMDSSLYVVRTSGATKEIVASAAFIGGVGPVSFVMGPLIPWPWPLLGPAAEPIVTRFDAGYAGDADDPIPAAAVLAIKLLVAQWYDNRESAGTALSPAPFGVNALLDTLRWS